MAIVPVISLVLVAGLSLLYYLALPRPIPGIPYNHASARSIMGDLPKLLAHFKRKRENVDWMTMQCVTLGSPVVQLFLQPFSYPLIVLSDHRETEDILIRRTREFDRSDIFKNFFGGLVEHATIVMPSHDIFKSQRRIWANTMSPGFLGEVGAPEIYKATMELIRLWRRKYELVGERPFAATENIRQTAMDAIWAIAVGEQLGGLRSQIDLLKQHELMPDCPDHNQPAHFSEATMPLVYTSISVLLDSVAGALSSPFPRAYKFFMRQRGWYRRANAVKQQVMRDLVRDCRDKFAKSLECTDERPKSAMEHVLKMEMKEQTRHKVTSRRDNEKEMIDESFMFLVAGHETTATTTTWALKFLASNIDFQSHLYRALIDGLSLSSVRHLPSPGEILESNIPLLDAAIAEILRCARTSTAAARIVKVDTEVLGHLIPKGSQIMCSTEGVQFLHDAIPIDESLRSETSKSTRSKYREWKTEGKRDFKPERWLDYSAENKEDVRFNPTAGPSLPFGGGPRGCFGKRLAYMELRIMITLLVLAFEFKLLPEELASYDAVEGVTVTRQPRKCYVRLNPRGI